MWKKKTFKKYFYSKRKNFWSSSPLAPTIKISPMPTPILFPKPSTTPFLSSSSTRYKQISSRVSTKTITVSAFWIFLASRTLTTIVSSSSVSTLPMKSCSNYTTNTCLKGRWRYWKKTGWPIKLDRSNLQLMTLLSKLYPENFPCSQ